MSNNQFKILIACHKPVDVYRDDVYTPIHVGRAVSKCTQEMKMMIGDDTGDNISNKNPYYSELTAQYWGWKNLKCDFIGLCLYSRYFQPLFSEDNIHKKLGNSDVILLKPLYEKWSMGTRVRCATTIDDYYIFIKCLTKLYPEYLKTAELFLNSNKCIPSNMFIMRKAEFDKFAAWEFSILFEMEKYVKISPYTRAARVFGYYGEMLLPIYCFHNHLKIKYENYSVWPGGKVMDNKNVLRDIVIYILYKAMGKPMGYDSKAVITGLKQDGIVL